MDSRLYGRVSSLYAELSDVDKRELQALNEEESSLGAEFDRKLLAANKESAYVTRHPPDRAGLSEPTFLVIEERLVYEEV